MRFKYESMNFETTAIKTQMQRTPYAEHSTPLFLTSSFVFEDLEEMEDAFTDKLDRNVYSRYSNPNVQELLDKVCALEGTATGIATASGMGAVFTAMAAHLKSGDHILASNALFGSTYKIFDTIFSRWNITHTYAQPDDLQDWANKIQPNTKLIYIETPSNPLLKLIDMQAISDLAKANNSLFIVDNCFATPYLQNPVQFGADIVIHSATKYMDGQGRVLGGLVLGDEANIAPIQFFARHTGPTLSPFNAWILSKSIETLALRMERHCASAMTLASYLQQHPSIEQVYYPFLASHPQFELAKRQMKHGGGIVSFEIKGSRADAVNFHDHTKLFSISSNLGDTRSILTHPASSALAKTPAAARMALGVSDQLFRISVGLEDVEDLIKDLEQALSKI